MYELKKIYKRKLKEQMHIQGREYDRCLVAYVLVITVLIYYAIVCSFRCYEIKFFVGAEVNSLSKNLAPCMSQEVENVTCRRFSISTHRNEFYKVQVQQLYCIKRRLRPICHKYNMLIHCFDFANATAISLSDSSNTPYTTPSRPILTKDT